MNISNIILWNLQGATKSAQKRKNGIRNYFNGRKEFILVMRKTVVTHFDELELNYSLHTEDTTCLLNK